VDCRPESVLLPENVFETKGLPPIQSGFVTHFPTSAYSTKFSNIHGFLDYDHLMPTRCGCKDAFFKS
jgi:hypothetical protein